MNLIEELELRRLLSVGISGVVYQDLNGDSVRQAGEPGLGGRTVFRDVNGNGRLDGGEPSAVSDASGAYRMANVPAGTQTVRQIVPDLWKASLPFNYLSVPTSGADVTANWGSAPATFDNVLDPAFADQGRRTIQLPDYSGLAEVKRLNNGQFIGMGRTLLQSTAFVNSYVRRFNADGTPDDTFGVNGVFTSTRQFTSMAVQDDGGIVLGGYVDVGFNRHALVTRLLPEGQLDLSFGTNGEFISDRLLYWVERMAVGPDGAIVVSCKNDLFRLTPQGQLDMEFNGTGYNSIYEAAYSTDPLNYLAGDMIVLPDSSVVVVGFNLSADQAAFVSHFDAQGFRDQSFGTGGTKFFPDLLPFNSVAVQRDGKLLIVGSAGDQNASPGVILRLLPNGNTDPSFGENGLVFAEFPGKLSPPGLSGLRTSTDFEAVLQDASGNIIAVGGAGIDTQSGTAVAVRLHADGTPDPSFFGGQAIVYLSPVSDSFDDVAIDEQGRLIAWDYDRTFDLVITRFRVPEPKDLITLDPSGLLKIRGTVAGDSVTVTRDSNEIVVSLDGNTYSFASSAVLRISADLSGGDDTITLPLGLDATVTGGLGKDTLRVEGTPDADAIALNPSSISLSGVAIQYSAFETLFLDSGAGDDTLSYAGTSSTAPAANIHLGDGNDRIVISGGKPTATQYVWGDAGDDLIQVNAPAATTQWTKVSFDGGTGNDAFQLNGTDAADTLTVRDGAYFGLGDGSWLAESFAVDLRGGNDTIAVENTSTSLLLSVNAGAGNDTINLGSPTTPENLVGDATFDGGDGSDVLSWNASGETHGWYYDLTPTSLTRTFLGVFTHLGIESVKLTAGSGPDGIRVVPSATTAFTVVAGAPGIGAQPDDYLTYLPNGASNVQRTMTGTGAGSYTSANRMAVTFSQVEELPAIDITPPTVIAGAFEISPGPQIRLSFSEGVSATLTADDVSIQNLATGQTFHPQSVVYDLLTNVAALKLPPMPDGNYHASIEASAVADESGNALLASFGLDFFVLAGDANQDRVVGFSDLVAVAQHYGTTIGATFPGGDLNYDGKVDFADLVIVAQKYGTTLSAPAADPALATLAQASVAEEPVVRAPAPASRTTKLPFSVAAIAKSTPIKRKPLIRPRHLV